MKGAFTPRRSSRYEHSFTNSLNRAGLTYRQFDEVAPSIEYLLCGMKEVTLNFYFPILHAGLRILVTRPTPNLPSLSIAFAVNQSAGHEFVDYVYIALTIGQAGRQYARFAPTS